MYKHILIATDGSELAAKAVAQGIDLAKSCNAKATIITVTEPFNSLGEKEHMFSGLSDKLREQAVNFLFEAANTTLKEAAKVADAAAIEYELKSVENHQPFKAIVSAAKQDNCDLIVMASHGRSGLSKFLLGSETMKTLTHTKIPTLVCR